MNELRHLDLFTGLGAFSFAAKREGYRTIAFSEIETNCRAHLAQKYPKIPNLGNVSRISKCALRQLGAVDVLSAGFPCQDLSVAGRRAGLAGKRSGLFSQIVRIARIVKPQWLLLENVPGLLSSQQGRDFQHVLNELVECGFCLSWRVLDAQYFGLAQRRKRVFIIGSFGNGRCAEVLFEPESMCWNPAPCRGEGERVAATLRSRSASRGVNPPGRGGEDDVNLIPQLAGCLQERDSKGADSKGADSDTKPGHLIPVVTHALSSEGSDASEDGTGRGTPLVAFTQNQSADVLTGDVMPALNQNSNASGRNSPKVMGGFGVRRLTPNECERLMGLPDSYTAGFSDSARYRMIGNSVAVPVVQRILRNIKASSEKIRGHHP